MNRLIAFCSSAGLASLCLVTGFPLTSPVAHAAQAEPVKSAILRFIPDGKTQGVNLDGRACVVHMGLNNLDMIMVGDLGESGQTENSHWSSGDFYEAGIDKSREVVNFDETPASLSATFRNSGERKFVAIVPAKISQIDLVKSATGTSVRVRFGYSPGVGWKTDYTCVIP